jgi:hypothetical protein
MWKDATNSPHYNPSTVLRNSQLVNRKVEFQYNICTEELKNTGKVRPVTARECPEADLRYKSHVSLTSALDGSWWSTPRSGRFAPGEDARYHLYRWLGGPQGTGAGNLAPHRDSNTSAIKAVRRVGLRVDNYFRTFQPFSLERRPLSGTKHGFFWFLTCTVTLEFPRTAAIALSVLPCLFAAQPRIIFLVSQQEQNGFCREQPFHPYVPNTAITNET